MRGAEWLVVRPWRLVLLVLLAVLPLLLVGELAAADTQQRVRADRENALRSLAERGAEALSTRTNTVLTAVTGASLIPRLVGAAGLVFRRTADSPPEVSIEPDLRELAIQLATLRAAIRGEVAYLFTVDGAGNVQAGDPPDGAPAPGLDVRNTNYIRALNSGETRYIGAAGSSEALTVAVPLRSGGRGSAEHNSLVAVLKARSIEGWLASLSGSVRDMYVVDRQGRPLARLNGEIQPFADSARGQPALTAAMAGRSYLGDGRDPATDDVALVATAPVPDLGWSVIAVAKDDVLQSEVDAAVAQQRALRFGLSAVLILGAVLVGTASNNAIRRRRETAEALEQQTATSDVLKTISQSAFDLHAVFDVVVENALSLCRGDFSYLFRREGDVFQIVASRGGTPDLVAYEYAHPTPLSRDTLIGRVALERQVVHIPDLFQDPAYDWPSNRAAGVHTVLGVPIFKDDEVVGAIGVARNEMRPFSDAEIRLVKTFADQAAIAIENVRLFNETKEALEQQTAVGDVLKTISRSAFDLQPVLDIVLNNAVRLAGADIGWLSRVENEQFTTVAYSTEFPESVREELLRQRAQGHLGGPWVPLGAGGGLMGFTLAEGRTVHLPDVKEDPKLKGSVVARLTASRTVVGLPMLRDGRSIGGMVLARYEVRPFSERELELAQTFADQAAIAIENVRLFNETKEALHQQTAVGDVLKTISRSAFDLDPVLATVVENAARLSDADLAWMGRFVQAGMQGSKGPVRWARDGDMSAFTRVDEIIRESTEAAAAGADGTGRPGSIMGRAFRDRSTIHIEDITADDELLRESLIARVTGSRTVLAVPLLAERAPIGTMLVARRTVRRFSEREVHIVETFADQAAIAIQNVRLFNEIEQKSRELEVASRHKSEFLANMSHELRTPLNAIIGFSEVLLQGLFGDVNEKQREYLADVLGSGQHLLSLINDILDLSKIEAGRMDLELTTFRFRDALDSGLTIVRERAARHAIQLNAVVASDVGTLEADERKVKQILYNLLSNAVKFTPDGGRVDVVVRPENGDVRVEVRDTGIGVAREDQERIFEEFRQVGRERSREGTGLGLTLTKRFVELHGGRIWLDSTPGQGSTFTFTLPLRRAAAMRA
jgi:signal transduction histidine kinase